MTAPNLPIKDRLERYIERDPNSGCWLWSGCLDGTGRYGALKIAGKMVGAHRASFEAHSRPLNPGELVCHHCDTPACVNPAHLYAGDHVTNAIDCVTRGRHARTSLGGERNGRAKLTMADALAIRAKYEPPGPGRIRVKRGQIANLAAAYGVTTAIIHRVVKNQIWKVA